ncbi:MAG: tetratricopeptide repeat protein [Deltaproteobacteria bacterium]|nr:tetratricopeptide repeat protein [Deltaproteobacteria bacterium]
MAESHGKLLILLLIGTLGLSPLQGYGQEGAEALFKKGLDLQVSGDLEAALPMYEKALEADPENYKALLATGLAAYGKGDYRKAADRLGLLVIYYPADITARTCLAYSRLQLGEVTSARDAFWKILADDPTSVAAMIGLGWSEFLAGDRFSAVEDLKKALAKQPNNKALRDTIGRLQDANKEALEAARQEENFRMKSVFNRAIAQAAAAPAQTPQSSPQGWSAAEKEAMLGLMGGEGADKKKVQPVQPRPIPPFF